LREIRVAGNEKLAGEISFSSSGILPAGNISHSGSSDQFWNGILVFSIRRMRL
jgi:hypothetical protein